MRKSIGIIGASGYTGFELIKLLDNRSEIELVALNSESSAGKKVSELYPKYKGKLTFTNYTLDEISKLKPDLTFLCMGEGYAKDAVKKLKCRVIDLSRDLRLSDEAVYGLPELFRDKIRKAQVVSNPGCYATACILAALPLAKQGFIGRIIFDCKSGYSGAGRTPSYLNDPKNYTDNVIAYKITQHQHRAEIQRHLNFENLSFTPHVVPTFRGLMSTAHIILKKKSGSEKISSHYTKFYKNEPFVKVSEKLPELHDVQNNNFCYIGGFETDDTRQLVVIATLDNLLKGASGQAVQNMNLMLGFDETEGLKI